MTNELSKDQEVVYLASGYLNASNIFNETFENGSLYSQFYNPFDWLASPSVYEEFYGGSNFCSSGSCVQDCLNLNQLFDGYSPAPFGVCMLFSNVSRTLANLQAWTEHEVSQLESFGFGEQSGGSFDGIATAVTACLSDACAQNPNAKHCAQSCSTNGLLINASTPSFGGVSDCLQQVCSQDLSFADFDLAGIGVTISYFLQIVIAISGIAYLLIMQKRSKAKALTKERRRKHEDRRDEFISSLVEFHKAQCFFVIAVQIAALVLMYEGTNTSQTNLTVIPITAAIGIQAPLFAYVAIARYGQQTSYLMILTTVVWILATATMWTAYQIQFVTFGVTYQLPTLPSCGNQDISNFCSVLGIDSGFQSLTLQGDLEHWFTVWIVIWTFSVLVLFSAIASWVQLTEFPRLRELKMFSNPISGRFKNTKLMRLKWRKAWAYLDPEVKKDSWLLYAILGLFAGSLCVELYQLGYVWKLNLEDAGSWTFGQIVAVLVWAAPLAEFVNLCINGIIGGSSFRLAKSFTVVRVQRTIPTAEMGPTHKQQRQGSDGDADVQLIKPDDDAMNAHLWSQQTVQEIADYDSYKESTGPVHFI